MYSQVMCQDWLLSLVHTLNINNECYRISAAAKSDSFHWLYDMYTRRNMSPTWGVDNQSMLHVYRQHAHRKEDMIAS